MKHVVLEYPVVFSKAKVKDKENDKHEDMGKCALVCALV